MARASRSDDITPRQCFIASGVITAVTIVAWAIAIAVDDLPVDRLTLLMVLGLPIALVAFVGGIVLAVRRRRTSTDAS